MYGFDRQKAKQVTKSYAKYQAKRYLGKAILAFLKTPAGLIVLGIFLIVFVIAVAVQMLLDENLLTDTLSQSDNIKILKTVSEEVYNLNHDSTFLISSQDYNGLKDFSQYLNKYPMGRFDQLGKKIKKTKGEKQDLLGKDFFQQDWELVLHPSLVYGYFKYRQVKTTTDILKEEDLKFKWWQIPVRWFNNIANIILPERRMGEIKKELSEIAEKLLRPHILYVRTKYQCTTYMTRTYTKKEKVSVYTKNSNGETVLAGTYVKTSDVVEYITVKEEKPVYVAVAAWTPEKIFFKELKTVKKTTHFKSDDFGLVDREDVSRTIEICDDFEPRTEKEVKTYISRESGDIPEGDKTTVDETEITNEKVKVNERIEIMPEVVPPGKVKINEMEEYVSGTCDSKELKDWLPLDLLLIEKEKEPEKDVGIATDYIVNIAKSYEDPFKSPDWMIYSGYITPGSLTTVSLTKYQNISLIPGQFLSYFQQTEKITGIPAWFLAGVAYRESSFNPNAKASNLYGVAVGLMQVQSGDWDYWVTKFKQEFPLVSFSGEIDDPYSQVLVGSYVLLDYIRQSTGKNPSQIDWEGEGWKEEIIPALAYYWEGPEGAKSDEGYEKCRKEYAPALISAAETYKQIYTGTGQNKVVQVALSFIGAPYVWGGSTPAGFDCSGFVYYIFKTCGLDWPRMTADGQYKSSYGERISPAEIQPGDVIFFDWDSDGIMDHVGIYLGNDKFVEAHGGITKQYDGTPNCPYRVRVADLDQYHKAHMTGAKRIIIGTM